MKDWREHLQETISNSGKTFNEVYPLIGYTQPTRLRKVIYEGKGHISTKTIEQIEEVCKKQVKS